MPMTHRLPTDLLAQLLQRLFLSVLMLLAPVLAVAFGVLLWGDVLTWKLVLGGVLTLAGIAVITLPAATR